MQIEFKKNQIEFYAKVLKQNGDLKNEFPDKAIFRNNQYLEYYKHFFSNIFQKNNFEDTNLSIPRASNIGNEKSFGINKNTPNYVGIQVEGTANNSYGNLPLIWVPKRYEDRFREFKKYIFYYVQRNYNHIVFTLNLNPDNYKNMTKIISDIFKENKLIS